MSVVSKNFKTDSTVGSIFCSLVSSSSRSWLCSSSTSGALGRMLVVVETVVRSALSVSVVNKVPLVALKCSSPFSERWDKGICTPLAFMAS